jgi:tRNA G18 (ribose-2'-O)-methylase SpoU
MKEGFEVTGEDGRRRDHVLGTGELRQSKPDRATFAARRRNPVTVVLDGVAGHYNIGAMFRLCDAFLVERLVICGSTVALRNRRFVQAAAGTERWVPWQEETDAAAFVRAAKAAGDWVVVVELTAESVSLAALVPRFPTVVVLGAEMGGVSRGVLDCADAAVAIPMLGMANSLNVATAGAIVLYEVTGQWRKADNVSRSPQVV